MVVERLRPRRRPPLRTTSSSGALLGAAALAAIAVLPLLVAELWTGYRLGLSDPLLSVIAPTEQPMSVRSPGGQYVIAISLVWFGLAYWHRRAAGWEAALVLIGSAAVLARLGNAWADAAFLVAPLARQLALARLKPGVLVGLATICLAVTAYSVVVNRPPVLPGAAIQAAIGSAPRGTVMADWRWAGDLQQRLGASRLVWAAGGLPSESSDFWLDYLRVAQGHQRWADVLSRMQVDLLVLDAAGQQRQAADLVRGSSDWHVTFDANGVVVAERVGS